MMQSRSGGYSIFLAGSLLSLATAMSQGYQEPPTSMRLPPKKSQREHSFPGLAAILEIDSCKHVSHSYEWLIAAQLSQYIDNKIKLTHESLLAEASDLTVTLYIKDNEIFIGRRGARLNDYMIGLYLHYIFQLKLKGKLPDLVLVLSGKDDPQGREQPVFSYCRRPSSHNDLLLPNQVEDYIWQGVGPPGISRAGGNDTRSPKAVWYGRPHAWHRGSRKAVSEASREHPDIIHAGLTNPSELPEWYKAGKEEEWERYQKEGLPMHSWAEHYKYQLNVAGNCASSRLAYQLHTDSAVFVMASEDQEWYTPLLRPYLHYVPVHAQAATEQQAASEENIMAQIEWAESHPDKIADIVERSTDFAEKHLRPGTGRDCYSLMLLHAYAHLFEGQEIVVPPDAEPYPRG